MCKRRYTVSLRCEKHAFMHHLVSWPQAVVSTVRRLSAFRSVLPQCWPALRHQLHSCYNLWSDSPHRKYRCRSSMYPRPVQAPVHPALLRTKTRRISITTGGQPTQNAGNAGSCTHGFLHWTVVPGRRSWAIVGSVKRACLRIAPRLR